MQRCANPNCKHDYCTRRVLYGDIVLCHWCYKRIPRKKRTLAIDTGKNQWIEELKELEVGGRYIGPHGRNETIREIAIIKENHEGVECVGYQTISKGGVYRPVNFTTMDKFKEWVTKQIF